MPTKSSKKKRKPRTTSMDMDFDGSHMFGWPYRDTPTSRKLFKRWQAGLCIGCGEKKCKCKSAS